MSKIKIVIADDEKVIHDSLRKTLNSIEFEYEILQDFYDTASLKRYLKTAKQKDKSPDILILDYEFGGNGQNGIEVLPKLREYCPNLPIIMLTTHDDDKFYDVMDKYSVDYVQKPVKATDLRARFRKNIQEQKVFSDQQKRIETLESQLASITKDYKNKLAKLSDELGEVKNENELLEAEKTAIEANEKYIKGEIPDQYEDIKKQIKSDFPHILDDDILKSLASAETTYGYVKSNPIGDYSLILLGYSKAMELMLKQILKNRHIPLYTNGGHIGMYNLITEAISMSVNATGKAIYSKMRENFRDIRNAATHKKAIPLERLEKFRRDALNKTNGIIPYMHNCEGITRF